MDILISAILLAAVLTVLFNEIYQHRMGVSPMPTVPRVRRAMLDHMPDGVTGTILEIGSGWGGIAVALAKKYPDAKVIGLERSPAPLLISRLRRLLHPGLKNLSFVNMDFFDYDMKDVDVIACYLSNPHMAKLEPKFSAELKPGALVVSSTFYMPDWKPETVETIEGLYDTKIYVYRAPRTDGKGEEQETA